jgi:ATP-binding cassette subfamily B protein
MIYFLLFNIARRGRDAVVRGDLLLQVRLGNGRRDRGDGHSYIWLTRTITEWRTKLRAQMNDLDGLALARAVDSLLNYETVKYFGAEKRERSATAGQRAYAEAAIKSENSLGLLNIGAGGDHEPDDGGGDGLHRVGLEPGRLSVGDLVLIQTYLTQLFRPLDMLGWVYRTIRQGLIDMAAMFRLIDTEIEVQDKPGAPALVVRRPTVAFDDVVFGYDRDREILHGLSFEVPAARTSRSSALGRGQVDHRPLLFRFYDPWSGAS